jgi:hypothetical protein
VLGTRDPVLVSSLLLKQIAVIDPPKKKKGLFWLTISEVSGDGQLAPLLWGSGEAAILAEVSGGSFSSHGSLEANRGRQGARSPMSSSRTGMPPNLVPFLLQDRHAPQPSALPLGVLLKLPVRTS